MSVPARIAAGSITALLLSLAVANSAAAEQQDVVEQVEARNQAAIAAYEAGNFAKMKKELLKAVSIGEDGEIETNPVMARTFVLSAILQIEGLNNRDAGVRLFAKALKISQDVQIPKGMATTPVKLALKQARGDGASPAEGAPPEKAEAAKSEPAPKEDRAAEAEPEKPKASTAAERKRAEAEARERDRDQERLSQERADKERDKQLRDLAQARDSENRERADKERLQKDRLEKEKALADAKGRLEMAAEEKAQREKALADAKGRAAQLEKDKQQLEKDKQALLKDKADKDKALADAKGKLQMAADEKTQRDKALADTKARVAQLEKDKQQLEKDRADRDKQLADTKARVAQLEKDKQQLESTKQQLEKDRADRDKQLAEGRERERKEKEAREKAEKAKAWAESNVKERESREEQIRRERERLAEGPDMPSKLPEPVTCTLPDEVQLGDDLFVHCAAQASAKTKTMAFYFRPSGVAQYNSLVLERSRKGWYTTVIPASRITGKVLQYYTEARDGRDAVVASNGKATSPNSLILRSAASKPQAGAGRRPPSAR